MLEHRERRRQEAATAASLRKELNEAQLHTLRDLERFGWELKFVRRPQFQESIPVVFDGERKTFAVIRPDGELDENPGFEIRP